MHVRLRKHITGARNGLAWPNVGELIELPDHEAADMIANGYAEEAPHATDSIDHSPVPAVDDPPEGVSDDDPGLGGDASSGTADSVADTDTASSPVKPKRNRKA